MQTPSRDFHWPKIPHSFTPQAIFRKHLWGKSSVKRQIVTWRTVIIVTKIHVNWFGPKMRSPLPARIIPHSTARSSWRDTGRTYVYMRYHNVRLPVYSSSVLSFLSPFVGFRSRFRTRELQHNLFQQARTQNFSLTGSDWPCGYTYFIFFGGEGAVRGSNPGGSRFSGSAQIGPGTHPASYTVGTGSFPGVKRPGRCVDHSPRLAPWFKKE